MTEGHLDATVMVAYIPQGVRNEEAYESVRQLTERRLDYIKWLAETNRKHIGLALTPNDLYWQKRRGRKALMMGIENGYGIGRDLSLIEYLNFATRV